MVNLGSVTMKEELQASRRSFLKLGGAAALASQLHAAEAAHTSAPSASAANSAAGPLTKVKQDWVRAGIILKLYLPARIPIHSKRPADHYRAIN